MIGKYKRLGMSVAALAMASTSAYAVPVDQVIILGEAGGLATASTGLQDRLIAAGYYVTITNDASTLAGDLTGISQIWDVRPNIALSANDSSSYLAYLNNSGGLFLLGENASFAARNTSLINFMVEAGGGDVSYGGTTVFDQYVTDIFNGSALITADSSTRFTVPASGTFSSPGNGTYITTTGPGGTGQGTGIAFGAGALTNAPNGRLLSYLDVNTFMAEYYNATPALRSLVDRMISFVAGDFQIEPTPGGSTIIDKSAPSFNLGDSAATGGIVSFDGGMLDMTGGTDPSNTISADVSISGNGAFINTAGNSGSFTGTVSGSGGLVVSGQGTLTLTGTNRYEGGTVITDSSTVQIASGDALGTGAIVLMGGQLEAIGSTLIAAPVTLMSGVNAIDSGSNTVTLTGGLGGAGGFIKAGSGTLVLTGASSYSGGTVIANGTLEGNASSITGAIVNGGNLVFDQATDDLFGGTISGTGSFTKTGDGRLNLAGTSSYSGDTTVDQGRLAVNGSIANSLAIVESGASIGGNGTVGGLIVRSNATAAPGNSIGQLHAATTVLFEAGSTYQVEVDASGAGDRIAASGVATLEGGNVEVLAASGTYRPQTRYQILTANGGVVGQFTSATSNMAFLMPTLSYDANSVSLILTRNDVAFADVAGTTNQRATAQAIGASFAPTSALYYALVDQTEEAARATFDQLSGEVHPSTLSVAAQQADEMRRALLMRLDMQGEARPVMWMEGVGSWNNLDANRNTAAVVNDARGFRIGAETTIGSVRIGIAGGYTDGDLHIGARNSRASLEAVNAALYAGIDLGVLSLRGGASYSDLDFKTHRTATVGSLSQQLDANYGGRVIQTFGEAGYRIALGAGAVEPYAGVNAVWLRNNAFTEKGGDLALHGAKQSQGRAWSTVGFKAGFPMDGLKPVSISLKAAWQHALTKRVLDTQFSFAGGGSSFSVEGAPLVKDAALVDAGINWTVRQGISLGVGYSGSLADQSQAHSAKAALTIGF